jgi:hypothetical protein
LTLSSWRDGLQDWRGAHCSTIYFYLWAQNDKGHSCPGIKIPHSIMISGGMMRFWFYTDPKDDQIRMRNIFDGVDMATLQQEAFGVAPPKPGEERRPDHRVAACFVDPTTFFPDIDSVCKHLSVDQVVDILDPERGSRPNGILQQCAVHPVGSICPLETTIMVNLLAPWDVHACCLGYELGACWVSSPLAGTPV